MTHGNTNDYTTMITTTTTTTLDSSSITKTTTSNVPVTHHEQNIDSPWKSDTHAHGPSAHSLSTCRYCRFEAEDTRLQQMLGKLLYQWLNFYYFVLEPSAGILLEFQKKPPQSKAELEATAPVTGRKPYTECDDTNIPHSLVYAFRCLLTHSIGYSPGFGFHF